MIDTNPRLPHIGTANYEKQLNARLYEVLRLMAIQLNAVIEGKLMTVTTTQKNSLVPAEGTVVFDTTLNKACVYTGSAWETITSS